MSWIRCRRSYRPCTVASTFFYSTRGLLIGVLRLFVCFIFTFINIICSPRRTKKEGTHHEITGSLVILPFLFGFVVCRQIIIYCVDGEDTLWCVLWGKTGQTDDPLYLRVPARGRIICINCSFFNERVGRRGESAIGGTRDPSSVRAQKLLPMQFSEACRTRSTPEYASLSRTILRFIYYKNFIYRLCKFANATHVLRFLD